jgi:hypothetical protein
MQHMPRQPQRLAPKEMGLRAVEQLQSEMRRIYTDIDAQTWSAPEKVAHFNQIFGVFASWFLAAMPPGNPRRGTVQDGGSGGASGGGLGSSTLSLAVNE